MTKKFNIGHIIPILSPLLHVPHSKKDFVKQLAEFTFATSYSVFVAGAIYVSQASNTYNKKLEDYTISSIFQSVENTPQPAITNSHLEKLIK